MSISNQDACECEFFYVRSCRDGGGTAGGTCLCHRSPSLLAETQRISRETFRGPVDFKDIILRFVGSANQRVHWDVLRFLGQGYSRGIGVYRVRPVHLEVTGQQRIQSDRYYR